MISLLLGCNSRFNEDIMYGTVGSKLEKVAPGNVTITGTNPMENSFKIDWINPTDKDLYGIKITPSFSDSTVYDKGYFLPDSISLTAETPSEIPQSYIFANLSPTNYTFKIQTFDKNLNYSSTITCNGSPSGLTTVPPVQSASGIAGDGFVTISWVPDETIPISGITISCSDPSVDTISLPKGSNQGLETTYTFYNLENKKEYSFNVSQYDSKLNHSASVGIPNKMPLADTHTLKVSPISFDADDSTVSLSWTNPTDDDFYGIQIKANPAEGNLSTPVYYYKLNPTDQIPNSFKVIGLDNGKPYDFIITVINKKLYLSNTESNTSVTPNPKTNTKEVESFRAIPGDGFVDLYWDEPDSSLINKYKLYISQNNGTLFFPKGTNTTRINNLSNGVTYFFTMRTIDINNNESTKGVDIYATPDSGVSGIYSNKELFYYKNKYYTYDFGYCNSPKEHTFSFSSNSQMDLTTTTISSGPFTVVSYKNTTRGAKNISSVSPGDTYEITVKYTPSQYNAANPNPSLAKWDEADLLISGKEANKIRLIGSNFPQPNSINPENQLRLWLRADLISSNNMNDINNVISIPDYSGNHFDAKCSDTSGRIAPIYDANNTDFNGLPSVKWSDKTNAQLISAASPYIVDGDKGSTTFIVFKLEDPDDNTGVISANFGASYPILKTKKYTYNDYGYYINGNDVKYALAVKGQGMKNEFRNPCISPSTSDPRNKLLLVKTTTDPSACSTYEKNYCKDKPVYSVCMTYDRTISPNRTFNEETNLYDYPSNIRMFVNNEERLLAYFSNNNGSLTYQLTEENNTSKLQSTCTPESDYLLSKNSIKTYGIYGRPWGDGKGHRYGDLGNALIPSKFDLNDPDYIAWVNSSRKAGIERTEYSNSTLTPDKNSLRTTKRQYTRMFDIALAYNPPCNTTSETANDYFENWISPEKYKNGTITVLTLGPDFVNSTLFKGAIAEVIIFEGCLSDDDIAKVNNYIKYRYNIREISTDLSKYQYETYVTN